MIRPQFVYFDLGRVLLHFDHEIACRQMGEVAGISSDVIRELVFESGLEIRYERGEISTAEFYDEFCQRTDTSPPHDALLHAAAAIFTPNQPVFQLINELYSQAPLGILSNTCEAHWEYAVQAFPVLQQAFGVHALSYKVRAMKPEPSIYEAAQRLSEAAAPTIFFVDDIQENVDGARSMGWDAVLYTHAGELRRHLAERHLLQPKR